MLDTINLILSFIVFGTIMFYFHLENKVKKIERNNRKSVDQELEARVNALACNIENHRKDLEKISNDIDRAYRTIDQIQEKIAELEVSTQNLANKL